MATKDFLHNIDLQKENQLLNVRLHNITTADRTTLAGTLNSAHEGLTVWDTDLKSPYHWNGTSFIAGVSSITGAMIYRGAYSNLTTAPATPAQGDVYVITAAGTLTWAGQTFNPSAVVQANDQVVYRGSNVWDVLQGNAVETSETSLGLIELATQAEVNAGTDTTRAVTPATLNSFVSTRAFAKVYFNSSITTVANTPLTITHNLGLQNKDAFTISVKNSSGSEVSVDVDSVNTNSLTITTGVALTTGKVCVIGF